MSESTKGEPRSPLRVIRVSSKDELRTHLCECIAIAGSELTSVILLYGDDEYLIKLDALLASVIGTKTTPFCGERRQCCGSRFGSDGPL